MSVLLYVCLISLVCYFCISLFLYLFSSPLHLFVIYLFRSFVIYVFRYGCRSFVCSFVLSPGSYFVMWSVLSIVSSLFI